MAVPLDAIRAMHNAFRKDMEAMDDSANGAAHGHGSLDLILKRYRLFNEVLVWHANGEEEFVFTKMEEVAPLISKSYEQDHRGLDPLFGWLTKSVGIRDSIEIARATAAFNFHLRIHLSKEDVHLYRVFDERVSLPEQGIIIGKMAQKIPQERFPEVVAWLYPLIAADDRENMARVWQQALPKPAFARATQLIKAAIGDGWAELIRRMPELE